MNRTAGIRPLWLVIGACLWMATVGNVALWGEMRAVDALQGPAGWAFGAGLALMVAALLAAIVSLLAWRWTLKPVLILLLMVCAAATHFMLAYHVVIDSSMIVNVLQTDVREAAALFDWRLLAALVLLGLLPAIVVWRIRVRYAAWPAQALRNLAMVAASLAVAVGVDIAELPAAVLHHAQPQAVALPDQPAEHAVRAGRCRQQAAAAPPWRRGAGYRRPRSRPAGPPAPAGARTGGDGPQWQLWPERLCPAHDA